MKKRLLITSIVMMLVVAVALSTATYAWFTSSATATANTVSLTAATSSAPSLGISWVDGNWGTYIEAVGPTAPDPTAQPAVAGDTFAPAAPSALTVGTTTVAGIAFNTALTTPANGGDMVFLANGASTNVYRWNNTTYNSFFIKNMSPSNSISTITLTATIQGDGSALLRAGVFKKTGNDYVLLGVLANKETNLYTVVTTGAEMSTATTYYKKYLGKYVVADSGTEAAYNAHTVDFYDHMSAPADKFYTMTTPEGGVEAKAVYGSVEKDASVNAMATTTCVSSIDIVGDTALAAGGKIELVVLVWEDAIALGDAEQGEAASIQLNFNA